MLKINILYSEIKINETRRKRVQISGVIQIAKQYLLLGIVGALILIF